jgi:hypothetical protein
MARRSRRGQKDFPLTVADVSGIVAALTFAALISALTFEWGYFEIIGSKWQALQTLSDYFSNVAANLPFVLLVGLAAIVGTMLLTENFGPPISLPWRLSWITTAFSTFILGLLPAFAFWEMTSTAATVATGLMALCLFAFFFAPLPFAATDRQRLFWFLAPATLIFFCYFGGLAEAQGAMKKPATAELRTATDVRKVTILRILEKGVLLTASGKIEFIQWEEIKALSSNLPDH